ncbi:uncharacterized protein K452DRAFT_286625 [Aplosporella prunicola CBS 121167]|uniref:Uncharacterized protein n=1 Tax=Aplosporella prunicola CBS 121167 TaxID=1176127 RepID=A0A6A6BFR9_9PEZI|nr:uncharacterized protein K452DRAFT_286625 [Aplosporella prunicola CBS 121167]KAF2142992.1 hypothetical protein K452DRAFT_286625 [Aplosporella prunicola CBS 121167]
MDTSSALKHKPALKTLPANQTRVAGPGQQLSTSRQGNTKTRNPELIKFPVDEIFYGNLRFGQALEDDDEYEISHSTVAPAGVSQYVYRQVHHYLWNAERQVLVRDGKDAQVIHPYRKSLLNKDHTRSATIIRMDDGHLLATREDASRFTSGIPYEENPDHENDNREWDYIAEKYQGGTELPLFGDSDDEYSPSLLAEIEEDEEASDKAKPRFLSKEEVIEAIDQKISEHSQLWREKKLPLRERTARTIWRKGRRPGERRLLIAAARDKIERIECRLTKLKGGILGEVYNSPAQVKDVCGALEESVNQVEEELWRITVWEQKIEPPRSATQVRSRKRPIAKVNDNADDNAGELVNSDSEVESDGLTDFVDVDEFEGPGTRNAQGKPSEPANHADTMQSPSPEAQDHDSVLGDLTQVRNEMEIDELPAAVPEDDPPLPSSSPPQVPSAPSVIDLTFSSDPPTPVKNTPTRLRLQLNSTTPRASSQGLNLRFSNQPENDSDADIGNWDYRTLEERSDRKRIILKLLRTLKRKTYKNIKAHINELTEAVFPDHIFHAMEYLQQKEGRMPDPPTGERPTIVNLVKLYACWTFSNHRHFGSDEQGLLPLLPGMLKKINTQQKKKDIKEFYNWVRLVLEKHESPIRTLAESPSTSSSKLPTRSKEMPFTTPTSLQTVNTMDEVSDDNFYEGDEVETPYKKRKRPVVRSASGINKRQDARKRQLAQAERERDMRASTVVPSSQNGDSVNIMVNTLKEEHETAIYIPSSLAGKIKSHQIEGVRFMWREVVRAGHTESQGCLLAHTMGLGKTMQSITLLATIAQAAHSSNETIRKQVPDALRKSQTLILCPASLVPNWVDELSLWMPKAVKGAVGPIYSVAAEVSSEARLSKVSDWYHNGGILVMSYDMLRILATPTPTKPKIFGEDTGEQYGLVSKQLLEGPNIIIADEAHTIRNPASKIRQTVIKFKTKTRIALTGSPLANNLEEYWSAIDWISPDYLGSIQEFRERFVRPIQEGFYKESTKFEHRKALKMLKVLKMDITPKVHRADITALKNDLKSKVEFVITVPLTSLQEEAYKICVNHARKSSDDTVNNMRIFEWMSVLTLICDHPAAFAGIISNRKIGTEKQQRENENNEQEKGAEKFEAPIEDPDIVQDKLLVEDKAAWISSALVKDMQNLFEKVDDLEGPGFSYKTELFVRILNNASKVGDGVLVFSHRLDTLDYLERLLENLGKSFVRLDGKTKMTKRPSILSKFNNKQYDIILMSTRAGGTGFNLPGANRVVIFDFGFNPQHEEQAIGRAYRLGQEKEVFVYRLMTGGTFEEKVWNKALFKTQLATRVVDTRNPERQAEKMREYLFPPVPVEQQDLSVHEGKDVHVLDKVLKKSKKEGKDVHIRCITTTEILMAEDAEGELDWNEEREVQELHREERLRKENPQAYLRAMQAKQFAPHSTAPAQRPPQVAGHTAFQAVVQPNSTRPLTQTPVPVPPFVPRPANTPDRRDSGRSGLVHLDRPPSPDAGVNNAGPSPASMIRTLPNTINPQAPAPPSPHSNPAQGRPEPTRSPGNASRETIPQLVGTSQANPVELTDDDTSNNEVESGDEGKKSADGGDGPQSSRKGPGIGKRISGWFTGSQ